MADWITIGLSYGTGVTTAVIVLQVRSFLRERREFAEQAARDERWDREHGIGGDS